MDLWECHIIFCKDKTWICIVFVNNIDNYLVCIRMGNKWLTIDTIHSFHVLKVALCIDEWIFLLHFLLFIILLNLFRILWNIISHVNNFSFSIELPTLKNIISIMFNIRFQNNFILIGNNINYTFVCFTYVNLWSFNWICE